MMISDAAAEIGKIFPMCEVVNLDAANGKEINRETVDAFLEGTFNEVARADATIILRRMKNAYNTFPNAVALVLFTTYDLHISSINAGWCFGAALSKSHVSVQSIFRYQSLPIMDQFRCIRRTLRHELGHIFGMVSDLTRANTEDKLGPHCTNPGCSMRQSGTLQSLLLHAVEEDRLDTYFCEECLEELHRRFPQLNSNAKKQHDTQDTKGGASIMTKTLKCWHGYQSGFVIETPSATLIFDWVKSQLPPIPQDKPLHIFISHVHEDHFDPSIFSLANTHKDVSIYLGYDDSIGQINDYLETLPKKIYESIFYFDGECELQTHFGKVESLTSTDLGVAFLVRADGMTLYHAGDLFPWSGSEMEFLQYTAPLQGVHIDYAMLPMDPRFPSAAEQCVSHYLKLTDITYFTPMHLWDKTDFASVFARQNPQYCGKMIAINPEGAKMHKSIEPLRSYMITVDAKQTGR